MLPQSKLLTQKAKAKLPRWLKQTVWEMGGRRQTAWKTGYEQMQGHEEQSSDEWRQDEAAVAAAAAQAEHEAFQPHVWIRRYCIKVGFACMLCVLVCVCACVCSCVPDTIALLR